MALIVAAKLSRGGFENVRRGSTGLTLSIEIVGAFDFDRYIFFGRYLEKDRSAQKSLSIGVSKDDLSIMISHDKSRGSSIYTFMMQKSP